MTTTTSPMTPSPAPSTRTESKAPEGNNPGSNEMKIEAVIRWRIFDPFKFLSLGGKEQAEKSIIAIAESLIRSISSCVEMDALIGLKLEVEKCVHQCFSKGEAPVFDPAITPIRSLAIGICITFIVGMIPWLTPLAIIPSIGMTLIALGIGIAGLKKINVGSGGCLTVLGKRVHMNASEGDHWILWPIFDFEIVDLREQVTELRGEKNILVIAGNAKDAGEQIPQGIAERIDHSFSDVSGIDVKMVTLPEILPTNQDILRARERYEVEKAEALAEGIEMDGITERAKRVKSELGVSGEEALRSAMAQAKHLQREEIIVNGAGKTDALIAGIIAAVRGIKGKGGNRS